jgi:hypothetical protein
VTLSDSISQRASLFTYHLVRAGYSPVPSSRFTLITWKTLVSSPTDYASSGSGSVHRTVTFTELATDQTPLTSSRACHRHVTPEVPPSYGEEFARIIAEGLGIAPDVAAEGLGVRNRRGRRGSQGRGSRPQPVPDARRPANAQPTQERLSTGRPSLPTPAGFEHNRGPAFIPFRIRNEHGGETLARYIRTHLDGPNPYVEGRLSLNGPTYHSEIHAAAIHDLDVPPPMITADLLRLLDTDYMGHERVDEALGEIGDRSLQVEVNRYRQLSRKHKSFEESCHGFP